MFYSQNILLGTQNIPTELIDRETIDNNTVKNKTEITQKIKECTQQLEFQNLLDKYYQKENEIRKIIQKFKHLAVLNPSEENLKVLEEFQKCGENHAASKKKLKNEVEKCGPIYQKMMNDMEDDRRDEAIQRKKAFHERKIEEYQKLILQIQNRIEIISGLIANLRKLIALDPIEEHKELLSQNEGVLKKLEGNKSLQENIIKKFYPKNSISDMTRCLIMDKLSLEKSLF